MACRDAQVPAAVTGLELKIGSSPAQQVLPFGFVTFSNGDSLRLLSVSGSSGRNGGILQVEAYLRRDGETRSADMRAADPVSVPPGAREQRWDAHAASTAWRLDSGCERLIVAVVRYQASAAPAVVDRAYVDLLNSGE